MSQTQTAAFEGVESFAAMFEESLQRSDMRAGEVISAEVVWPRGCRSKPRWNPANS
jgi:small subunit ribosomal protein S1